MKKTVLAAHELGEDAFAIVYMFLELGDGPSVICWREEHRRPILGMEINSKISPAIKASMESMLEDQFDITLKEMSEKIDYGDNAYVSPQAIVKKLNGIAFMIKAKGATVN